MDTVQKHQYTIGVVARRTHVQPETLRVWERRYDLIVPGRSETGRRLYSEADIIKLSLVKQLTELGHPVSGLAKLSIDALRDRLSTATASAPNDTPRRLRKCRVIFFNESFSVRMRRELLLFQDIDVVEQWQPSGQSTAAPQADVLIIAAATINEQSLADVRRQLLDTGCAAAVVVFNFGTKMALTQLERAGVVCLKGAVTATEIHRACLSLRTPAPEAAPQVRAATVPAPRRFNAEQLARVAGLTGTIVCECPNHLAELIGSLSALEQYSSECANRNDKDAELHAQLNESAAKARTILEESLARLIEIEGIVI